MTTSPTRAVILAGGDLTTVPTIGPEDLAIAADSGYDHAMALGVVIDVLVGDLDSISPAGLEHAQQSGIEIQQHPPDKDDTDLELAIKTAMVRHATTIDIYGGEGGRLAHLLGVALSTAHRLWKSVDIVWHTQTGILRTAIPKRPATFSSVVGESVTLLPIGDASGVTTQGLRWPLEDAVLERGTSRGVSNEATAEHVSIEVQDGAVLVIQEGLISQ